eukprot:1658648-Rhodomonas_salina.1
MKHDFLLSVPACCARSRSDVAVLSPGGSDLLPECTSDTVSSRTLSPPSQNADDNNGGGDCCCGRGGGGESGGGCGFGCGGGGG